jgi:hypothetical protein
MNTEFERFKFNQAELESQCDKILPRETLKARPMTGHAPKNLATQIREKSRLLSSHLSKKQINVVIFGGEKEKDADIFVTKVGPVLDSDSEAVEFAKEEQTMLNSYNDYRCKVENRLETANTDL